MNGSSAVYAKPIHTYKEVCSVARVYLNTSFYCYEDIGQFGVAKGYFFHYMRIVCTDKLLGEWRWRYKGVLRWFI